MNHQAHQVETSSVRPNCPIQHILTPYRGPYSRTTWHLSGRINNGQHNSKNVRKIAGYMKSG